MLETLLTWYTWIVAGVSVYFLVFTLVNVLWLRLYSEKPAVFDGKHVSVCVPARNEEGNIEDCVRSLMSQSYGNYDVIVLDDNSEDATSLILERLASEFPGKLRIMSGRPLASGWTGKIFAMYQLVKEARGEYLLFTDADTVHGQDSIAFAVTNLEKHNADMVSGYIGQRLETFGERITVPLMYMLTGFVLPLFLNRISRAGVASVAIGQYIMIKKSVLDAVGGYETMRNMISEDVYLARIVKKHGYKTIFIDCKRAATCRMYTSYQESVHGIMKNIFSFMSNRTAILLPALVAVVLFLFLPFPLFVASSALDISLGMGQTEFTFLLGANVVLMFVVWMVVSLFQQLPLSTPFLYPLLFANLAYMALLSYAHSVTGTGYVWKGRVVH